MSGFNSTLYSLFSLFFFLCRGDSGQAEGETDGGNGKISGDDGPATSAAAAEEGPTAGIEGAATATEDGRGGDDTLSSPPEGTTPPSATKLEEVEEKDVVPVVVSPPPRPRQFSSRKAYQFLHEIVTAMAPMYPWVSLSLFLQCAIGADHTGFKAIAYEFFSQVCEQAALAA